MRSELFGRMSSGHPDVLEKSHKPISDEQELVPTAQRDLNPGPTALLFASSAIAVLPG
jgi:hypothetical protein